MSDKSLKEEINDLLNDNNALRTEINKLEESLALYQFLFAHAVNKLPNHELRLSEQFLNQEYLPEYEIQNDFDLTRKEKVFTSIKIG